VTAADMPDKLEKLREIGCDRVLDCTREDFPGDGPVYDVLLDVPGKTSFAAGLRALKKGGTYLLANPRPAHLPRLLWTKLSGSRKAAIPGASDDASGLNVLREWIEAGRIRPVVGASYPLEQAADAHRHVESGRKIGNVVLRVEK